MNTNDLNKKILVSGGQLRSSVFQKLEEWKSCKRAILVDIDPASKTSQNRVEYTSPKEAAADELPAILFKSGTVQGDKLYICTSTEVMIYDFPSLRLAHYISLPIFNDLHHVCYSERRGTLLIADTGLDIVAEVSLDGNLVGEWDVLGADTWSIYSRDIDYRKVPTTKPHRAHANHVFELGEEVWVTRCHQRDAICLQDSSRRIDLGAKTSVHEGILFNGLLYFTAVDGHIILVDPQTLKVERVYDLNKMSEPGEQSLGYCRGVLLLDERFVWVGFTLVRPTKFRQNLNWIRHPTLSHRPSHLALYDLHRGTCLQEIETEPHGIGVVFSIFQYPQSNE